VKQLFTLVFVGYSLSLFCQFKHDYVWLMGLQYGGDQYPRNCMNILDFNSGKLQISGDSIDSQMFVVNASCSDEQGNLLFYSNGCYIKNKNHEIMPNGEHLNPGIIYDDNCPEYGYIGSGGIIILPMTENPNIFYVFHQASEGFNTSPFIRTNRLYYSKVDMQLDNGKGAVVEKNQIVLTSQLHTGLQAIRHSDGNKWWVISFGKTGNNYYKTLLSPNDVITTDSQAIGDDLNISGIGQMSFSPDGEKFAHFDHNNQLSLFDFDRKNGLLSNYQHIIVDTPMIFPNALAFSPNSRFLYVSSQTVLYQYDLEAPDVSASKAIVGEYDGFEYEYVQLVYQTVFKQMQLGPDCKIYMTPQAAVPFLHVINNPDEPGLACNFVQRGIELPCSANYSIPNFPHYRLGTGYPICDSSIVYVSSGYVPPPKEEAVRVWPNPASSEVRVELSATVSTKTSTLRLFDGTGRLVGQWELSAGSSGTAFSVADRPVGMYFWSVENEGKLLGSGKLIVQK
jgi:sugar lactone lactonase YvrE